MAGGIWDPKKRKTLVAIVAIIIVIAMVVPSVLGMVIGWF